MVGRRVTGQVGSPQPAPAPGRGGVPPRWCTDPADPARFLETDLSTIGTVTTYLLTSVIVLQIQPGF